MVAALVGLILAGDCELDEWGSCNNMQEFGWRTSLLAYFITVFGSVPLTVLLILGSILLMLLRSILGSLRQVLRRRVQVGESETDAPAAAAAANSPPPQAPTPVSRRVRRLTPFTFAFAASAIGSACTASVAVYDDYASLSRSEFSRALPESGTQVDCLAVLADLQRDAPANTDVYFWASDRNHIDVSITSGTLFGVPFCNDDFGADILFDSAGQHLETRFFDSPGDCL